MRGGGGGPGVYWMPNPPVDPPWEKKRTCNNQGESAVREPTLPLGAPKWSGKVRSMALPLRQAFRMLGFTHAEYEKHLHKVP